MVDLPAAGGADEGDGLAGFGAEGDAVQDLGAVAGVEGGDLLQGGEGDLVGGRVAEADVVELDGDRALGHLAGVGLLLDERLEVEHLEDALEADQRAHHLDAGSGERGEGGVEAGQEQGEGDDGARVEGAVEGELTAEAVDEGEGEGRDQGEGGAEDRLGGGGADADVADLGGARGELGGLLLGAAEEFDEGGAGCGEAFRHAGAHDRVQGGGLALHLGHPAAHAAGGHDEHGQQDEGEQGDLPGQGEHDGEGEDQRDQVADDAGEGVAEGALGADHVVVEPGDERAGAGAGEEGDRHPLYVVEHRRAQVEDESLTQRRRESAAQDAEHRLQYGDQRDEQRQPDHGR